jgi:hypothetical protein
MGCCRDERPDPRELATARHQRARLVVALVTTLSSLAGYVFFDDASGSTVAFVLAAGATARFRPGARR